MGSIDRPGDLIVVEYPRGIYLPEADLWLDPHFGVERAFVSHAHSDHVARHGVTFCSALTGRLMRARFGVKEAEDLRLLPMRQVYCWEGWEMRLYPAGHIVGSAMLHLTRVRDGATLLYTGDYKLRQGLSAERCDLPKADTLIMETTFGLPQYVFPPLMEVVEQVLKWVRETLDDGEIPVLLGYSLGKAQEILRALKPLGVPVMLHSAVWKMTNELREELGELPEMRLFEASEAAGHVLVFPPTAVKSTVLRKLKICRTAMLSGWALQSGARFRYQVDAAFPLSDHADYPELLQTVEEVEPRKIWLVHGFIREFAADLRRRGHEAWALGQVDQLELGLDAGVVGAMRERAIGEAAGEAAGEVVMEGGFAGWVAACESAMAESARGRKVAVLADWLRQLEGGDLMAGARFAAGLVFDPVDDGGALQVGWALVRRVLMDLAACPEVEYKALSRTQNDAGRTAFLMLRGRDELRGRPNLERGPTLEEMGVFFETLRSTSGGVAKSKLLRDQLDRLTAREGSWLIRLITGDLRMGLKEGLVDEAIALAFERPVEVVREAVMLGGDPGRAAVMAKEDRLDQAQARLFVPVKVMLASPEETAEAIWERMRDADALGDGVWLEDKYDGIRAQAHCGEGRVEIYSRDLKRLTDSFPEIVAALRECLGKEAVMLDGEIIAYAEDKKLSFFDLQKRLGRRDQADLFLPSEVTVRYVVFDVMWRNGESLLKRSLKRRREVLEGLMRDDGAWVRRLEVRRAGTVEEVEAAFMAARRRGNEGLIAKDPAEGYQPGRRGKVWLKLKKAFATLDVVVVKVEQGHGKRSHMLSDYTFAVRDEGGGGLRVIGKAYSGLTNEEIEELTQVFLENTVSEKGRVREVLPNVVLEVAFDSIQASARHDSGLALRFPRIKAIRRDKVVGEIDTLSHARRLAGVS
jgi:DNA ligase-1